MNDSVRVVLVGVGGFGQTYVNGFLNSGREHGARIVGVVDPAPRVSRRFEEMKAAGVEFFGDLASFFAGRTADLVVISAPIHLHVPFSVEALSHGSNVLCEKPLAGSVGDALRAIEAAGDAPGFLAIGYQWSFSDAVQALKRDILSGVLGRPERFRTFCCWPRGAAYYARNNWAGRIRMPDGAWVLDSPANNAAAHFLHNMLYLLGPSREAAAMPIQVQAELYRANPIENYDTAAIRCRTEGGAEVLFYATHAGTPRVGPVCRLEFERGVVTLDADAGGRLEALLADGTVRDYGRPEATRDNKIWQSVAAVGTGQKVACTARTALAQTLCVCGAQRCREIAPLPGERLRAGELEGGPFTWMEGLREELADCYERACLPSERPLPWARPGRPVDTSDPRTLCP
jgi:predicted dehydrogenase